MKVNNSNINDPVSAYWADVNGNSADNNGLYMKVVPSREAIALLTPLSFKLAAEITPKIVVAGNTERITVLAKPQVLSGPAGQGVDEFSIYLGTAFGKPSNIGIRRKEPGRLRMSSRSR
ncbi:MAG: hypothetical protein HQL31_06765 [Planctomycetes bacterium]|nr:hypothetical protein [Planctomycetota bacterium]